jgi:hypothetical protein
MYDGDNMSTWKYRKPRPRRGVLAFAAAAICACLLPISLAAGSASAPEKRTAAQAQAATVLAHAARLLVVNDEAHMTLTNPSSASATLVEEGRATGTLPGTVRARLTVGANSVTAGFTIYLSGGTISGHSAAHLNPGKGEYASFGGSLVVSHGSGHYAHASGGGALYGTINRNTDNATVQVVGKLHY